SGDKSPHSKPPLWSAARIAALGSCCLVWQGEKRGAKTAHPRQAQGLHPRGCFVFFRVFRVFRGDPSSFPAASHQSLFQSDGIMIQCSDRAIIGGAGKTLSLRSEQPMSRTPRPSNIDPKPLVRTRSRRLLPPHTPKFDPLWPNRRATGVTNHD